MTTTKTLDAGDLRQFTGSENWYRHGLVRSVLFTDGAKYLADQGGAYWLLDEIALAQRHNKRVAGEEFQFWKLAVNLDKHKAVLTCDDGNGNIVFSKRIPFTDFPLDGNQPLFLQQHHPVAERVLTGARPRPQGRGLFPIRSSALAGHGFAKFDRMNCGNGFAKNGGIKRP